MVTTGSQTEKLIIGHERQPHQRNPVPVLLRGKNPTNAIQRNFGMHANILYDVRMIIEIDESILIHIPEYNQRENCQGQINNHFLDA
jgi:hypothetical protein